MSGWDFLFVNCSCLLQYFLSSDNKFCISFDTQRNTELYYDVVFCIRQQQLIHLLSHRRLRQTAAVLMAALQFLRF